MAMIFVLLAVGCDQATKALVREHIAPRKQTEFAGGALVLTHVENAGAFLSAGSGLSGAPRLLLLVVLPAVILAIGLLFILTHEAVRKMLLGGVVCVVGGGAGNLYDRMLRGAVTDFMQIDLFLVRTGIFNVADVFISAGVLLIAADALFHRVRSY